MTNYFPHFIFGKNCSSASILSR